MNGAESLIATLEALDVDAIFGLPGGAILPAYDPLLKSKIRHILVRHEQDAGHAAEGYALATGRVGVCIATSGPGATNLITPLADAYMDSVPIVAITGQVEATSIGTDAFQEVDIRGMSMPITKHSVLVTSAADIPRTVAEAFHIARTGRPGPVLVDISKTALTEETTFMWPPDLNLPGYRPKSEPCIEDVQRAAHLLKSARRPVLYVGGGVIRAGASAELAALADGADIPVVTTLTARGAFPDSHPLHLGMPGMHGTVAAVAALQRSDLIFAIGARFDDRVTGEASSFAPGAKVIHADIDPAEIGKNRQVEVGIEGDCKATLAALCTAFDQLGWPASAAFASWRAFVTKIRDQYPPSYQQPEDESLAPEFVLERLGRLVGPNAIYVAGVGQHQMWASQYIQFEQPSTWISSGGLGTMGFSVPAAMGAQVGRPDASVWSVDGDGCFQMTGRELATCAVEGIPIKVALINNGSLGMVRQLQTLYYSERINNVSLLPGSATRRIPDFPRMAEALGCVGMACDKPSQVDEVIERAKRIDHAPVLIDFRVQEKALVWPSIAAGASNDDLQYARDLAPRFDEADF